MTNEKTNTAVCFRFFELENWFGKLHRINKSVKYWISYRISAPPYLLSVPTFVLHSTLLKTILVIFYPTVYIIADGQACSVNKETQRKRL